MTVIIAKTVPLERLTFRDLRKHEIFDIDIDRENLRLKTDKFIVSAVYIYSGMLGVSHHMTEYFINRVSDADYPNERAQEIAQQRLKNLECSFREEQREF